MRIYDISQEVFGSRAYPGDPTPTQRALCSMKKGDAYNLTEFCMCAHNGTHVDAPFHFLQDGKTVDAVSLEHFVGTAFVTEHCGTVRGEDAEKMIEGARAQNAESAKRILIKGPAMVSPEAASVFARAGLLLLGNESQSVGPEDTPMEVHRTLLAANVMLLEGICLEKVPEGVYLLNAAPLNLSGAEGSPCRAILLDVSSARI